MKLRIRANTIRLRLKRSEVEKIANGTSLEDHTPFPGATLTYRLQASEEGAFEADLRDNAMTIQLPITDVREWAASEQVSLFAEQGLGETGTLSVLVEKDFQCLSPGHHRSDEDDRDTYPHPEAATGRGC